MDQIIRNFESGLAASEARYIAYNFRIKDYENARKCIIDEIGKDSPNIDFLFEHYKKMFSASKLDVISINKEEVEEDREYLVRVADLKFVASAFRVTETKGLCFFNDGYWYELREIDEIFKFEWNN